MKTPLKTLAGLGLAVAAWMKLAQDFPVGPPPGPPYEEPYEPPGKPECGYYQKAELHYDSGLKVYSWECVPDPSIPRKPGR